MSRSPELGGPQPKDEAAKGEEVIKPPPIEIPAEELKTKYNLSFGAAGLDPRFGIAESSVAAMQRGAAKRGLRSGSFGVLGLEPRPGAASAEPAEAKGESVEGPKPKDEAAVEPSHAEESPEHWKKRLGLNVMPAGFDAKVKPKTGESSLAWMQRAKFAAAKKGVAAASLSEESKVGKEKGEGGNWEPFCSMQFKSELILPLREWIQRKKSLNSIARGFIPKEIDAAGSFEFKNRCSPGILFRKLAVDYSLPVFAGAVEDISVRRGWMSLEGSIAYTGGHSREFPRSAPPGPLKHDVGFQLSGTLEFFGRKAPLSLLIELGLKVNWSFEKQPKADEAEIAPSLSVGARF